MIIPNLPWIIGPVPILLTLWSIYDYASALRNREVAAGAHVAAAYLLPVGIVSLLAQLLFSQNILPLILVSSQILSAIIAVSLILYLNYSSSGSAFLRKKTSSVTYGFEYITMASLVIVFIINIMIVYSDPLSPCTIGKCYVLEYTFGSKSDIFSNVYMIGVVGAFFLSVFIVGVYSIFFKRKG
ncbi:hypothetical protein [Rhizobium lusitanum]|uniref:hypothetical protein n=1 Tax=Rhizobium lusitanum TaxID=293958 RepID=UPI0019579839|nr:hypothetical protein [Rhizobium lusitanum]MBM7046389.1 hypothetical protein [Rhizobium lusitanum]